MSLAPYNKSHCWDIEQWKTLFFEQEGTNDFEQDLGLIDRQGHIWYGKLYIL